MNDSIKTLFMRATTCIALTAFICGCASTTVIRSKPEGAIAYLDNIRLGPTPQKYSDTAILGSTRQLRLEKAGYLPLNTVIRKDEFKIGPCIGGICLMPIFFLWVEGYPSVYEFALEPAAVK